MDLVNIISLVVLAVLVVAELSWSLTRQQRVYSAAESLANLAIAIVNGLIKPLTLAWSYLVMSWLEPARDASLPETGWAFLLTFIVVDLVYYGYHRSAHQLRWLWTLHHTHHSSPWYNFTTAIRLNWIAKFITPLYFAPLVLLGFSPEFVTVSLALGLVYQLVLHTQAVPALGRFEGVLLNTPSAHRVHHGSNPEYIDKNFAGVFIVWDRLFGTYQPEGEAVRYGVTTGFVGHNPFVIQLAPLTNYLRGQFRREADHEGATAHAGGLDGVGKETAALPSPEEQLDEENPLATR